MNNKNSLRLTAAFLTVGLVAVLGIVLEKTAFANTYYSELVGGAPLIQTWTDINQITTDDNWTGVVSFQGFRGDNLTATDGVDPQTVIADGTTTPLDVNANQTNPNTFATGGATEFQITNPTVALKGSGTADAPHLMIYLNTVPCPATKSVTIRYDVRDIDGSANDAVQQVALQYRLGPTGNFTNVPAGYVADATNPNTATRVTQRIVNLPHLVLNQPQLELRILTTNAAGTDEWVGIDNIEVGCYFSTASNVEAGGRVLTATGNGISRATVTIRNLENGDMRTAVTNQFGYYNFDNLEAGGIYAAMVEHKKYVFTNDTQVVQLFDNKTDLIFYADYTDFSSGEIVSPKGRN